jgi:hypothetical protein
MDKIREKTLWRQPLSIEQDVCFLRIFERFRLFSSNRKNASFQIDLTRKTAPARNKRGLEPIVSRYLETGGRHAELEIGFDRVQKPVSFPGSFATDASGIVPFPPAKGCHRKMRRHANWKQSIDSAKPQSNRMRVAAEVIFRATSETTGLAKSNRFGGIRVFE